jgi:hypothetical protein
MAKEDRESLRKSALDALAKQLQGRKVEVVAEETDTVASSKETVVRFLGRPADEPNAPHVAVVLDSAGKTVELSKLQLAEGRAFFPPPALDFKVPDVLAEKVVKIQPAVNDIQLTECGFRERIVVSIPAQPIGEKVDVYFLADTTGSMGAAIASVKAGATTIMNSLLGMGLDVQFGVGNYRDFTDAAPFTNQQTITGSQPLVTNAINNWIAGGGGDTPEGQLFALEQLRAVAGWRPQSVRFVVWFGDAPGHEPICAGVSPAVLTTVTRATAIAALKASPTPSQPDGIAVLAISVIGGPGLDAASSGGYTGCPSNGLAGQATDITTATKGSLTVGVNPGAVAAAILAALIKAVQIQNVSLVPSASIAPFVTSISPAGGYGPLDPTKPHQLTFDVVFERGEKCSLRDQVFTGSLDVVMDHVVVAKKPTKITIPKCRYHYTAKFVCGVNDVTGEGCSPVRPGRYSTEINIYNGHCSDAVIEKHVTPVVLKGEAIGREPRVAKELARDKIVLPPHAATMDDCCRLAELLKQPVTSNGPLLIGFLEIVSNVPLTVTAVYTATGLRDDSVSIDVEQIVEVRK